VRPANEPHSPTDTNRVNPFAVYFEVSDLRELIRKPIS